MDRLKGEIKEKNKLIEHLNDENAQLKRRERALEVIENKNKQKD